MNSKECLERIKKTFIENEYITNEDLDMFTQIETDLDFLETLRNKLDRKIETKEYRHEESNTYRLSTLLTYEIKEQWEEKEIECLRQFLLNLSGVQKDLNRLELKEYENEQLYKIREQDYLIYSKLKEKKEKQDEILRIIKEKRVHIALLKRCLCLNDYNVAILGKGLEALTQAEFDLLKEWLE